MILNDFTVPKTKFSNEQLDAVLVELCEMVIQGKKDNPDFNGMVAAAVIDPMGRLVTGLNYLYGARRVHGERVAIDKYEQEYGELPRGSIVVTTCSPCSQSLNDNREGSSCSELLNSKGVKLAYCGYKDPTQKNTYDKFVTIITKNTKIKDLCRQFADTFLKNLNEKQTYDFEGIEIDVEDNTEEITVRAMAGGRQMGFAHLVKDGNTLLPQKLEVDERYQGQGVARVMYDYLKSKGWNIRRSGQQTDAGRGFWQKHRPQQNIWESQKRLPRAIEEFLDSLAPDDVGVEDIGAYRIHFEGFTDECKSSSDYRRNPEALYQQVFRDFIKREGGAQPIVQDMTGDEDYPILYSIFRRKKNVVENKQATAQQVLSYINKTHHEPFHPGEKMYQAVLAHPHWELKKVPLLNLNIPDQEYDDVDYDEYEPESDPYGRAMLVDPKHAGRVSQDTIDQRPIVIDADRYIIDGNHRAWAAKYLLNRDYIMAWQPVQANVDEDYDPNGPPPGPEFKPTMPRGTVRVDVSDMYDWYKLGKNLSNLKVADKSQFGKGPPSTIVSFGDEDTEHRYINDLENIGLTTTDIDPIDKKQPKGMPRQKVDPTYNVNENFADGKGPGRPGDSQRHGIHKNATMAELEKASHSKGRKGQLARWQLNMRRGKKKHTNEESSKQILSYVRRIHPRGEFKIDQSITDHPEWELTSVPLASLHIESDNVSPYGQINYIDYDHVASITLQDIKSKPIVIDNAGWIIDGNHRAVAARDMGMKYIPAYVPVELENDETINEQEINELFDRAVKNEPAQAKSKSKFKSEVDGHQIDVRFNPKKTENGINLEIDFYIDGRGFAVQNTIENPMKLFSAAVRIMLDRLPQAISYYKPTKVWYKALGYDASRVSLYRRLLDIIQQQLGPEWKSTVENVPGWKFYTLTKTERPAHKKLTKYV